MKVNLCLTAMKKNLKLRYINESYRFVINKGDEDG
jgi:hypothetical protein